MGESVEDRIVEAYASQPMPVDPGGLQRILARREAGERVTFDTPRRTNPWVRRVAVIGVAATFLLFVGISNRQEQTPNRDTITEAESSFLPLMLMAQGSERPSFPTLELDGPELKPGEWTYAPLRRGAIFTDSIPLWRSRLSRGDFNHRPAWLMLSAPLPETGYSQWSDTAWVDQVSLKLLARSGAVMSGAGRITEEFREHDVLKGFTTGGTTTWSVIAADSSEEHLSNGVVLRGDVLYMAIRRARLSAHWHGSIEVRSNPIYDRVVTRWYDLSVVGEERVSVPAGDFDCWKIHFGPPSEFRHLGQIWIYVSKDKQWIIKQGVEGGTQGDFWSVLVSGRED